MNAPMIKFAVIIKERFFLMRSSTTLSLFALTVSLASMQACSSSRKSESTETTTLSHWQKQPLIIDGSDSDWTQRLNYSDHIEKFTYDVTNDADNIYIRIATNDQQTQQKIIQGGMTVWINNKAQKDFDGAMGIGYPLDARPTREQEMMKEARPDRYTPPRKHYNLQDCDEYALYHFGDEEAIANYPYGQPNKSGVQMKMGYNNKNVLLYEASVPLAAVFPRGNSTGKSYAVGIYLEGIPGAEGGGRRGGGGGVSVGGGLGFGSFGSGGGLSLGIGSGSLGRIGGNKGALNKQGKTWQVVDVARPDSK
jgi:hypothetical protein